MEIKEAIKILNGAVSLMYQTKIRFLDIDDYKEAKEVAIEALEKQIPKKPKEHIKGVYDDDTDDWIYDSGFYVCPRCKELNEVYRGWDFCQRCGQHIDWSEVE